MKSLLLVCALMLAAGPLMAEGRHRGGDRDPSSPAAAQHGIDGDRAKLARQDNSAAEKLAEGHIAKAAVAAAAADRTRADIAADLAGCPSCH